MKQYIRIWDNYLLKLSNLRPEVIPDPNKKTVDGVKKDNKPKKEERPPKRIEEFVYNKGKMLDQEIQLFYPEKKDVKSLVESSRKSKFEVMLDHMYLSL